MLTLCSFALLATTLITSGVNALPYQAQSHTTSRNSWPAASTPAETLVHNRTSTSFPTLNADGYHSLKTRTTDNSSIKLPDIIRGVNIGGWLVLEKWMNSAMFQGLNAIDQYTFDQTEGAQAKLESHWASYFTEADVQKIASYGINALRIPIGYWAYNNTGTPYITGADAYLEQAIGWARNAGLIVLLDCHGSPGSQNGFDNSGRVGNVEWQEEDNLAMSISVLQTMAQKYGSSSYADVVYAIELVNEPISGGANIFGRTQTWAQQAYTAVKKVSTNNDLRVVMHDAFMGASSWEQVGATINGNATIAEAKFAIDVHLYQNQVALYSELTQAQHISKACHSTTTNLLPPSSNLPVIVGEFSASTNICVNPDGTTIAGNTCTVNGCQCSSDTPIQYWRKPLVNATRMFVEAQMDAYEHGSRGWFIWAYHGPGGWGLDNLIQYGVVGQKVTDRLFPKQCNFSS